MPALFSPEHITIPGDVSAACLGLTPEDAWSALVERGVLPRRWRDASGRRFSALGDLPEHERAQRRRSAPYVPMAAHPDESAECVHIASMWPAMETAEQHGHAFVEAAALWGMPRPTTILWVPIESYAYQIHDTKPGVWEPDSLVWRIFPTSRPRVEGVLGPWTFGDEAWRAAKPPFVDRPSPFVRALAIFACGFGLLPSSTEMLVLGYPTARTVRER